MHSTLLSADATQLMLLSLVYTVLLHSIILRKQSDESDELHFIRNF